ncbi:MAG: helix-turn-helix domain-containing protein [Xanthobacteraceae bacterium]
MRPSDCDLVRALPLFRDVSATHFDELMNAAFLQRFPQHVVLVEEGRQPDFLHIVVEGTVELFSRWGERETTLDIIRPVTTFNLAAVILDALYFRSARTLTPAQILMLPAASVRDVFDRDVHFARAIVAELALREGSVVRALKDQKLRNSAERLANWILESDRQQGAHGHVTLGHDKRTLASRLGMTPENLSRNLASLAELGISSSGREIVIGDPEALRRWARPDPLIDGS